MAISKNARRLFGGDAARSVDNIRGVVETPASSGDTGTDATRRALSKSPPVSTNVRNHEGNISFAIARELVRTADGRAELRRIVSEMSPKARENLQRSIAMESRDPRSPAKAISLTPEGQAISDIAFGNKPSRETVEFLRGVAPNVAASGDVTRRGTDLMDIEPGDEDMAPLSKPKAPAAPGREIDTRPQFRTSEGVVQQPDGSFSVRHSNANLGGETQSAINVGAKHDASLAKREQAIRQALMRKYGSQEALNQADPKEVRAFINTLELPEVAPRPTPVYDDPNPLTDRGGALIESSPPKDRYDRALKRLAGLVDPHEPPTFDGRVGSDLELTGVPSSVFAPTGASGKRLQGGAFALSKPQDYADLMRLARQRGISPADFENSEDFARALVAGADQEMFNVTPVTARQRADATEMVREWDYEPDSAPVTTGRELAGPELPQGQPTAAAVGKGVRTYMPGEVAMAKSAERAIMQEQAIETLARKAEEMIGWQGWGANHNPYKTRGVPGEGSTEVGMRQGMAQDVGNVPALEGRANQLGEAPPLPVRQAPGKPGMTVDPEVGMEDLEDLDARRRFATGDESAEPLPNSGAKSTVTSGRVQGDKKINKPSPAREEGGNKPGEYADEQSFSEYNRDNPATSSEDLSSRQSEFDALRPTMPDSLSPRRVSELRREIRALIDANPHPGPDALDQIKGLNAELRKAERLDSLTGIRSMKVDDMDDPDYIPPVNAMGEPDGAVVDGYPEPGDPRLKPTNPVDDAAQMEAGDPAAVNTEKLDASATPLADEAATGGPKNPDGSDRFAMDDQGIDETPEKLPEGVDTSKPRDADVPTKKGIRDRLPSAKKAAVVGGGLIGLLGGFSALRQSGQPKPYDWNDSPVGGGEPVAPMTPEQRIRATLRQLRLNPNTQIPTSWTE